MSDQTVRIVRPQELTSQEFGAVRALILEGGEVTLGAGDIFHGAFCHRYVVNGFGFRDALEFASAIASRSCQYFGTRAWMNEIPSAVRPG
jgi:sugar/nucleoside kinase (ribokinase family)